MILLMTMLPFYLFGNLHCLGMCGPLAMMIGKHHYRYFYFFGRLSSFSLTGLLAGGLGEVLQVLLKDYHLAALTSFIFGGIIIGASISTLVGWRYPGYDFVARRLAKVNQSLSFLILKDRAWPTFLFGFFTVALPCGQTVIVFSACALSGDMWVGFINGLVFALLTTPSLYLAMHMYHFFSNWKKYHHVIMGVLGLIVGVLAISRGLADVDIIPHFILNPNMETTYHIVIY